MTAARRSTGGERGPRGATSGDERDPTGATLGDERDPTGATTDSERGPEGDGMPGDKPVVLGGYGAVGRAVAGSLAPDFPAGWWSPGAMAPGPRPQSSGSGTAPGLGAST